MRLTAGMHRIFRTVVMIAMLIGAGQLRATPTYNMVDLGSAVAIGLLKINDNGVVLFGGSYGSFVWSAGSGRQSLGADFLGMDINNAGQVVGRQEFVGAVLRNPDGTLQPLGALDSNWKPLPYGINNTGQVVGDAPIGGGSDRAFLYSGNGPIQNLGTLGGQWSVASAINDSGEIVGRWNPQNSFEERCFYYGGGQMNDLGTFGADKCQPTGINNAGQIVGNLLGTPNGTVSFIYANGHLSQIGTGPLGPFVYALNDSGVAVGENEVISGNTGLFRAVVYDATTAMLQDLNDLIAPNSVWTLRSATDINAGGQIVSLGTNAAGEVHGFLLSPIPPPPPPCTTCNNPPPTNDVPEPGTLALLGMAAASMELTRRRRPTQSVA